MNFINHIDASWTLFLDRDGVINHEKKQDYIRNASEFVFYDGTLEALKKLSQVFNLILIVTNQRGIGKGLMTHQDLHDIHEFMSTAITQTGGRIDRIYYAPDLDSDAIDRKPNIGMGLTAKTEFPSINFEKSIIIGNNISDMKFGKGLGMHTVYVETTNILQEENEFVDMKTDSLVSFTAML
jgi:histidinol-phosphate phosphatase family protein